MKCKLAEKAFYMAIKAKILDENDKRLAEAIRFYGYENLTPKAKIVLAQIIVETEKAIKEDKNG